MNYEYWAKKVWALKNKKLSAMTIGEFEMTHGMAAAPSKKGFEIKEKTEHLDKITKLMTTLENISKANNGNTPRLGLYGDMSWDLVNMETDEWILGGDNVFTDINHIIESYREFSTLERALRDLTIEKVEFNRAANQLHRQNELRRSVPKATTDAQ